MKSSPKFQVPTPPNDQTTRSIPAYPGLVDSDSQSRAIYPPLSSDPNAPSAPYPMEGRSDRSGGSMPSPHLPLEAYRNGSRGPQASAQHSASSRPPSSANATEQIRSKNLSKFINKYEINKIFADRLRAIQGCEIVFVCDDSGSMNLELHDTPGSVQDLPTRWDELKRTVSIVVDVATTLDPDGVDVYFLNRPPLKNVRTSEELHETFSIPPEGPTPMIPVLRQILQDKREEIQERKLILLIATDGQPTDHYGNPEVEQLRQFLERERRPIDKIPVTIIACTDDDECMSYLNDWDDRIPYIDVVDDYQTERKEIQKIQPPGFPFSFGDYVMKILLGGVDPWFRRLDNEPIGADHPHFQRVGQHANNPNLSRFGHH